MGLVLPRVNMENWTIRYSEEWLTPIYNRIHEMLLSYEVLHMDGTRIQCNKEDVKKANSDSFMWVIRNAACESIQGAFFYYSRARSGYIAKQLLSGFQGYLITDAYAGYEKADNIKRNLCWAHVRRYFIFRLTIREKLSPVPKEPKVAKSSTYCSNLKFFCWQSSTVFAF